MTSLVLVAVLAAPVSVESVPATVRQQFKLAPHYTKYVGLNGLPIVGSRRVADAALREAHFIASTMLMNRPDVIAAMAAAKTRLAVMAPTELTTDIPEHATLSPKSYWDRRARGLGATIERPAVSCAEENLLNEPGDPYQGESICVHEFAHALLELGVERIDATFRSRLVSAFKRAKAKGTWKKTYAMENENEYWAEAVQSWFDTNLHDDFQHGPIDTREEVMAADPAIAELIVEVLGDVPWRYRPISKRTATERAELGEVPAPLPTFSWPKNLAPLPAKTTDTTRSEIVLQSGRWPTVSPGTNVPAVVDVTNRGHEPITWDWVGFNGELVRYGVIAPGATLHQETWLEHVWVISRRGVTLGWFSTPGGLSTVTVR